MIQDKTYEVYALRLKYDTSHEYRYVGMTSRGAARRLNEHLADARRGKRFVHSWIRKHYYQITVDVLEVCESLETMQFAESKWICILRSEYCLLNMTDGADGNYGLAGENNPMFGRKGQEHPAYGRKHTEAELQLMRIKNLGELNPRFGKKDSIETRERKRQASIGRTHSTEVKQRISQSNTGRAPTRGGHVTWHERRNIFKPGCAFCE